MPGTPPLRSVSRSPFLRNVAPPNNSEDGIWRLEVGRAESMLQAMSSEIAQMGHVQTQQNQMNAAEIHEDMLRERNVFEQHGAQKIVVLAWRSSNAIYTLGSRAKHQIEYPCANPFSEAKSVT